MMNVTMTNKPGPKKVQSEGRADMPRTPASRPAGHSEPWVLGLTSFLKRMPLVAQSLQLLSGGDRSKDGKHARMPTPEELTVVVDKLEKEVFCDALEKDVFYDALDEDVYYDAQEFLNENELPSSSCGQGRQSLNHVPTLSDYIGVKSQGGAQEKLASDVWTKDSNKKAQREPVNARAALLQKKKEVKNLSKTLDDVLKELVRLEKKSAKVCRKNKRVMDKVVKKRVQIFLPVVGERHDVTVREPDVVDEKEVPDDETVMETASAKSACSVDAVSCVSTLSCEKNSKEEEKTVDWEVDAVADKEVSGAASAASPMDGLSYLNIMSYLTGTEAEEKDYVVSDIAWDSDVDAVDDNSWSMETASTRSLCSLDGVSYMSTVSDVGEERTADVASMMSVDTYETAVSSDLAVAMEIAAVNEKKQVELVLLETQKGGNMESADMAAQDGAKKHGKYCRAKRWVRSRLSKGWRRLTRRGRGG